MGLLVHYMEYTNRSFGKFYHFGAVKKGVKFHTSRTSLILCFKANLIPSTRILNKIKQVGVNSIGEDIYQMDFNEMKAISNNKLLEITINYTCSYNNFINNYFSLNLRICLVKIDPNCHK